MLMLLWLLFLQHVRPKERDGAEHNQKVTWKKNCLFFIKNVGNQMHHRFSFELWCLIFGKSDLQWEEDFSFHFLKFIRKMEIIMHLYLRFLMHIETANFYLLQKTVILSISASVLSRNEWQKCLPNLCKSLVFLASIEHIWLTHQGKRANLQSPVTLHNKYNFNPLKGH